MKLSSFKIFRKARTFVLKGVLLSIKTGLTVSDRLFPSQAARWGESLFLTPQHYRRTANERKVLARARQEVLRVGQDVIKVWHWGTGPRIILTHGWSGRGGQFYHWVDLLTEAGFTVTLFDAPGHGSSEGKTGSLVQIIQSLEAIIEAHGPAHGVVGHSLGGAAVIVAAAQGLPIQRVITLNAPADIFAVMETSMGKMGLRQRSIRKIWQLLEQRFGVKLQDFQPLTRIAELTQPALLIHDLDDKEVPWSAQQHLKTRLPHAEVLTTQGAGHYRVLRKRDVILKARDFLMGHSLQELDSPAMELLLGQSGQL